MIIDKILDRYDGDAYDPKDFYDAMMSYEEGTDFSISRALDSGEEEDIKRELCAYIDDGNYNPKIKDFINSVKWLEADDGKDYSKEFDILGESKKGESKFKCSMEKKKESLAKTCEDYIPNVRERLWSFIDAGFITTEKIGDYLLRALSVDTLEKVYEWLVQDEMIPSEETLADEHQLKFGDNGEFVSIETDDTKEG